MAARGARSKAAPALASPGLGALPYTDIVDKVRRIQHDWPFPLSVVQGSGIVRNQVVRGKPAPKPPEDSEPATF